MLFFFFGSVEKKLFDWSVCFLLLDLCSWSFVTFSLNVAPFASGFMNTENYALPVGLFSLSFRPFLSVRVFRRRATERSVQESKEICAVVPGKLVIMVIDSFIFPF